MIYSWNFDDSRIGWIESYSDWIWVDWASHGLNVGMFGNRSDQGARLDIESGITMEGHLQVRDIVYVSRICYQTVGSMHYLAWQRGYILNRTPNRTSRTA